MAWYNASWGYRVKVTVLATKVDEDLSDFPVYVDLNSLPAGFHTNVNQTDARDIRVTTADETTEVPREVVFYDSTTDTGELHFKGNILNSTDVDFYIYYGNASATEPAANATYGSQNVWDANYLGVYHMQQSSGSLLDSTVNARSGTFVGNLPDVARAGILSGNAQDLDGTGDWATLTIPASVKITRQCWFYPDALTDYQGLLSRGGSSWAENVTHIKGEAANSGSITFDIFGRKRSWNAAGTGAWKHIVCTYNNVSGLMVLYGNGTSQSSATVTTGLTPAQVDYIGNEYDGARDADGIIDEVRFSDIDRTATWVSTEYNNQVDPSTFFTIGIEETAPVVGYTSPFPAFRQI